MKYYKEFFNQMDSIDLLIKQLKLSYNFLMYNLGKIIKVRNIMRPNKSIIGWRIPI